MICCLHILNLGNNLSKTPCEIKRSHNICKVTTCFLGSEVEFFDYVKCLPFSTTVGCFEDAMPSARQLQSVKCRQINTVIFAIPTKILQFPPKFPN